MLPTQLMVNACDEKYYNRGKVIFCVWWLEKKRCSRVVLAFQDENTLEKEALSIIAAGFSATPVADAECVPGLNLYDMFRRPLPVLAVSLCDGSVLVFVAVMAFGVTVVL
jgi:hypothetical protein